MAINYLGFCRAWPAAIQGQVQLGGCDHLLLAVTALPVSVRVWHRVPQQVRHVCLPVVRYVLLGLYYKVRPGEACPRCAPSEYCFGESANWLHRPRYRSQLVSAHRKEPEKPMPSQKPSHPDGTKEPQKQKPSTKPKEPKKPKPHKTPIKLDTVEKSDVPSEPEKSDESGYTRRARSLKDPEKP
ncbi:hypothetical protein HPB51_029018 [Rhipicephalus microplus]|uniref:Uncharacterized protein n=1 Tax=Rhipicephalus microplus TaxID=6941 RepID=A0A9J6CVF5_RHIMP|nr:hypothetical protein HPB51_029018 [Rhipicephalus microplus]